MNAHALNHLFMDDLAICGCGMPQTFAILVRDILRLCPLYENRPAFEKLLPNDGVQHGILSMLSNVSLIEHGGGIGGSWLTSSGKEVLEALNRYSAQDESLDCVFDDSEDWITCSKCTSERA